MTDREREFVEVHRLTREDIFRVFGLTAKEIERLEAAEAVDKADQMIRDAHWRHIQALARELDAEFGP